jgi:hypothetical protein
MVSMKVGDKNMADPGRIELVAPELDLRSLPAIDQKKPLIHIK